MSPKSNFRIVTSDSIFRNKENGVRQGYMGHLINIANNIVSQCEKNNILASFLKNNLSPECLSKWENLVNTQLVEINKVHQTVMMVRDNNRFYTIFFFSFAKCVYCLKIMIDWSYF